MLFNKQRVKNIWKSEIYYLINLTALYTGCRIGEILALTIEKVCKYYIVVSASYDRKYGLKGTKSGYARYVPIPVYLYEMLISFYNKSPNTFIFPSPVLRNKPISYNSVTVNFKKSLIKIGITSEIRKERLLSFHSYRHYVNTKLIESGISDEIIRRVIGHRNVKMTENYSHIDTRFINLKIIDIG